MRDELTREQRRAVELMTNWQRCQWAKLGYRKRDIMACKAMMRPKAMMQAVEAMKLLAIQHGKYGVLYPGGRRPDDG